jgi:plastocyanin
MYMRRFLVLAAALVVLGGGCAGATSEDTASEQAAPASSAAATSKPSTTSGEAPAAISASVTIGSGVEPLAVSMVADNFSFRPTTITAKPGQVVDLTISSNTGFHTFVIDAINLKETTKSGEVITFTAPLTPGSYEFYCDVGSHQAQGMEGVLIVE